MEFYNQIPVQTLSKTFFVLEVFTDGDYERTSPLYQTLSFLYITCLPQTQLSTA